MQAHQEKQNTAQYTWSTGQEQEMEIQTVYPEQDIVDLYTHMDNDFVLTTYEEAHLIKLQSSIKELIKTRDQIQESVSKLVQETIVVVKQAELRHTEYSHLDRWYRSGIIETIIQDAYLANPITPFCISCNGTLVPNGAEEGIFYNPRTWIPRQEAAYEAERKQQQQELECWIQQQQGQQQQQEEWIKQEPLP
ncbi:hypothetical protein BDC45DRAFT_572746 [Circinella umbellata]|nr:hypothetical protein BDC45DRAFT_572746 [Circinella umbellata]